MICFCLLIICTYKHIPPMFHPHGKAWDIMERMSVILNGSLLQEYNDVIRFAGDLIGVPELKSSRHSRERSYTEAAMQRQSFIAEITEVSEYPFLTVTKRISTYRYWILRASRRGSSTCILKTMILLSNEKQNSYQNASYLCILRISQLGFLVQ